MATVEGGAAPRGQTVLFSELKKLHIRAGEPSSREVAAGIGGMSHSTVNNTIRGKRVPSWPVLSKVVSQLGGDEGFFRSLWVASRDDGAAVAQLPTPISYARPDVSVFVSYASIDEEATHGRIEKIVSSVRAMYESMTGDDAGVFFDKHSVVAGENWQDAIRLNLSSSAVFLAFLSPSYIRSEWCNNEFWEFYRFLEANSSERLIIPVLFGEPERMARIGANSDLWTTARTLQTIDASPLRVVEPGQTEWLQKTSEIAGVIDKVLSSREKRAGVSEVAEMTAEDDEELAPTLFEQMIKFEQAMPELQASTANITDLFYKVGHQVAGVGPMMGRARTPKRMLSISRQLSRSLEPIAEELSGEVTEFLRTLKVWDVTVQTVFDFVRRNPPLAGGEQVDSMLRTIVDAGRGGIDAFGEGETLSGAIGQGRGLSRELDRVLKKLQAEILRLADSRAIFRKWLDEGSVLLDEAD